jgi:hypothetical protein
MWHYFSIATLPAFLSSVHLTLGLSYLAPSLLLVLLQGEFSPWQGKFGCLLQRWAFPMSVCLTSSGLVVRGAASKEKTPWESKYLASN